MVSRVSKFVLIARATVAALQLVCGVVVGVE